MSYTAADLAEIRRAIATGAEEIVIGTPPERIRFRSVEDLLRIERVIQDALAAAEAAQPAQRLRRIIAHPVSRGW